MVTASLLPAILGFRHLGTNLSRWPQPHGTNELITHGIYRRLRHPLYLSLILLAAGWARIAAKLAGTPCHGHFGSHPAWQGSPRGTAPRPEACPLCWLRPHNRALFASLASLSLPAESHAVSAHLPGLVLPRAHLMGGSCCAPPRSFLCRRPLVLPGDHGAGRFCGRHHSGGRRSRGLPDAQRLLRGGATSASALSCSTSDNSSTSTCKIRPGRK